MSSTSATFNDEDKANLIEALAREYVNTILAIGETAFENTFSISPNVQIENAINRFAPEKYRGMIPAVQDFMIHNDLHFTASDVAHERLA